MNGELIIRKQKIWLQTSNERLAFDCRQYLNEVIRDEVPKMYERIFHQDITPESYINIHSLSVDLGVISANDFKNNFIQILEQKIIGELRKQFEENSQEMESDTSIQYTDEKQQNVSALLFFLENGIYPWWYKKEKVKSPRDILTQYGSTEKSDFLAKLIIRCQVLPILNVEQLVTRFVNYSDNRDCEAYIAQLVNLHADHSIKLNTETLMKHKDLLLRHFDISLIAFLEQMINFILLQADEPDFLKKFLTRLKNVFPLQMGGLRGRSGNIDLEGLLFGTNKNNLGIDESIQSGSASSSKRKSQVYPPQNDEVIYVENAGLILMHPFLSTFFRNLEITDEHDQFISIDTQMKGAVLLYYLQCGNDEYKEWEMPLNKILCGMKTGDVIINGIKLSDREKEESRSMLKIIIDHWKALKGSSIEAMQNTFFLREGKITFKGDHWLVQIERSGVDILLDRLPWSIGTIKLPWLKELIYVEW